MTVDDTDDGYLTSGFQGHELANAAELLRDYAPFAEDGLDVVKTSMIVTNEIFSAVYVQLATMESFSMNDSKPLKDAAVVIIEQVHALVPCLLANDTKHLPVESRVSLTQD